ncbi:MAG: hypothetical protein VB131_10145, partial [Burkholderia gladioli]
MQKLTSGAKFAAVAGVVAATLTQTSLGGLIVLQFGVAVFMWSMMHGGMLLAGAVPPWVLALGTAGFA